MIAVGNSSFDGCNVYYVSFCLERLTFEWLMLSSSWVSIQKRGFCTTESEDITMINFSTLSRRISAITEENAMYTKGQIVILK